jgi:Flp pilus assembly protein TadD/TolB-like protein
MIGDTIGPYRVLEHLATGGMGEVYLAEDPRLGRRVAIKRATIPEAGAEDALARLRREAFAAGQLNHPNVAAIYDVLDADGIPHIVMEFVQGETLAQVVSRGPLPTEQVLSIARQVADALAEAHAHGVIHRDLKPANVMLTAGGRVKVLDFGIAREPARPGAEDKPKTVVTHVYGTPAYMAPEQLMGSRGDARSDIYSFGALLFELLTGDAPFKGDPLARIAGAISKPPQPRDVNPAVPSALNDLVVRTLAFRPDDRFQTVNALKHALERAAGAISEAPTTAVGVPAPIRRTLARKPWQVAAAVLMAVAIFAIWSRFGDRRETLRAPTVVAVLPFEVAQGEKELEGLATGLADIIVNGLAASTTLTALPRSASVGYAMDKPRATEVRRIARDLGANRTIDGALRRNPGGVDLTIRIGDPDSNEGWERTYSSTLGDVLTLGRRILGDIIVQLDAEGATGQQTATSLEAFQLYAQARGLLDRRDIPGNVDRAIALLDAAAAREPRFALAQAALGEACWEKYRQTKERSWVDRSEQATLLALSIDANQPLVRLSLATILDGTGHRDRAEQELRTIVRTHPVDSAHRHLGIILAERGNVDEAMKEFQRAIDVRPGYWRNYSTLGVAALKAGRYPEAERSFRRVTELQPDHADAYGYLGSLYLLTNQRDLAIEHFRRSIQASPTVGTWTNLGNALSDAGRHAEALEAFRQAASLRPRDPIVQRNLGDSLLRLGKAPEARSAYVEGVRVAREALGVNPKSADAHGALAICLAKTGEFDEALKHAGEAMTLAPNAPEPYHRRAAILALAGRRPEAIAALSEARKRGLTAAVAARDDDFASLRDSPEFQQLVKPAP